MRAITDLEIRNIEKILLPQGQTFFDSLNNERIAIIKEIENSCDVVACPGSGKTTVLLAKLLLLADRLPFENNSGICVLTHTNVAIDEIKQKAGIAADKLFRYPNFFGTFQSFVDKYLAIPVFKTITKYKPHIIDNEYFFNVLEKRFNQFNYMSGFNRDIINKVKYYFNVYQNLHTLRFTILNNEIQLSKDVYGSPFIITKPNSRSDWTDNEKQQIYEYVKKLKLKILTKERVLCYDDAYFLANFYISINPERIKNEFSNRFKYVFIDEMQDTDSHQLKIIEALFNESGTIKQYFGDPNQAIFDFSPKENFIWKLDTGKQLNISDSKRYGNNISNVLNRIKVENSIELSGNANVNSLNPVLLIFNEGEENKVLTEFVKIIHNKQSTWNADFALRNKKPIYKAIGWVAKEREIGDENKLNIISYWGDFEKKSVEKKQSFKNLISYCLLGTKKNGTIYIPKAYETIINAILHLFDLEKIKNNKGKYFTKTSFIEFLKQKNEYYNFRAKLSYWFKQFEMLSLDDLIHETFAEIQNYVLHLLNLANHNQISNDATQFINDIVIETQTFKSNKFIVTGYDGVELEVGTIHSVKGETHTATLYFETAYKGNKSITGYESERLIDFLKGNYDNKKARQKMINQTLKMVHVGFSRPTHLLCFALCKTRISEEDLELLDIDIEPSNQWEVIKI